MDLIRIFAAYDSINHDIYVANQFSNDVYVIDDVTDQVTSIIPAGSGPVGITHDPINNKIYVANAASDDITIINGSTNQPISTILLEAIRRQLQYIVQLII